MLLQKNLEQCNLLQRETVESYSMMMYWLQHVITEEPCCLSKTAEDNACWSVNISNIIQSLFFWLKWCESLLRFVRVLTLDSWYLDTLFSPSVFLLSSDCFFLSMSTDWSNMAAAISLTRSDSRCSLAIRKRLLSSGITAPLLSTCQHKAS